MTNNELLKQSLITIQSLKKQLNGSKKNNEKIAVVGMACRFPGGCNTPEAYWKFLKEGKDAAIDIPKDRWNVDEYYDAVHGTPGKMYVKKANFLQQDVSNFDAKFFKISPAEANAMDPQQRQLLEVSWEALENAGQKASDLVGSRTGVFIGINSSCEYAMLPRDSDKMNQYIGTGTTSSIASGRISYVFGFNGPTLSMDTACSSSLVSTLLAVNSLREGACDMALSGGVNLMLSPTVMSSLCLMNALSEDGKCAPFDASGDGYGRGEGCGILVLKRLSDAERDHDKIYAIIAGGAMNNDGASSGLTVPNGNAQRLVMEEALKNTGYQPNDISYLEAHGTGTALGDPIEVKAIHEVFGEKKRKNPLVIGAVKGNIGHLESAAGVASLIKVVLSLYHKEILPVANFEMLNPRINLAQIPAVIPQGARQWKEESGKLRVAGVSSFGFSGTNVHIIMEESKMQETKREEHTEETNVLTFSAKDGNVLKDMTKSYIHFLQDKDLVSLQDCCYTANTCRTQFQYRAAVSGKVKLEMIQNLKMLIKDWESGKEEIQPITTNPKYVFLFAGNLNTSWNYIKKFKEEYPAFALGWDQVMQLLKTVYGEDLEQQLEESQQTSQKGNLQQIRTFAMEYGISCLLKEAGIKPEIITGARTGTYVAAVSAGILSIEDAVKLLVKELTIRKKAGKTISYRVHARKEIVEELLYGHESSVSISGVIGTEDYLITGRPDEMKIQKEVFLQNGIRVETEESTGLPCVIYGNERKDWNHEEITFAKPKCRFVAADSGTAVQKMLSLEDVSGWLSAPIQYEKTLQYLYQEGYGCYVEIGSLPLGISSCKDNQETTWIQIGNQEHLEQELLQLAKSCFELGTEVNWSAYYRKEAYEKEMLPNYPFLKNKYWLAPPTKEKCLSFQAGKKGLEGRELILPYRQRQFQYTFTLDNFKELMDNSGVVHVGYYVELLVDTMEKVYKNMSYCIEKMEFVSPIMVFEKEIKEVLLSYDEEEDGTISFAFYSKNIDGAKWKKHVYGTIVCNKKEVTESGLEKIKASTMHKESSREEFYDCLVGRGFYFGPTVKWVQQVEKYEEASIVTFRQPDKEDGKLDYKLGFHPGILDSCAQACNYVAPEDEAEGKRYMISSIQNIVVHCAQPISTMQASVQLCSYQAEREEITCAIQVVDEENKVLVQIGEVKLKRFDEEKIWNMTNSPNRYHDGTGLDRNFLMKYAEASKEQKLEVLTNYVAEILASVLEMKPEEINPEENLDELGIDSMSGLGFYQKIVDSLGVELSYVDLIQGGNCKGTAKELQPFLPGGMAFKSAKKENKRLAYDTDLSIEHWIFEYKKKPNAKLRLFCFPYGFGSANMYQNWQDILGDEIDVCAIKIPGLDIERMKEMAPSDIDELMETLNQVVEDKLLDLPCASFGHSWGSLFAYRLAYRLSRNEKANFVKCFVSGYTSPSLPNTSLMQILSELKKIGYDSIPSEEELKESKCLDQISLAFVSAWGQSVQYEDFAVSGTKISLPLIAAAYRMIEQYQYDEKEEFHIPIVGFHGIDDYRVSLEDMNAWVNVTDNNYQLYTVKGDHGFIDSEQSEARVLELIKKESAKYTD